MQISSRRKPIAYFLCYHQAGAGAFTRLLRMYLAELPGVWGQPAKLRTGTQSCTHGNVFIKADEVQDLEGVFGFIQYYTRTFIACVFQGASQESLLHGRAYLCSD